MAFSLDKIVFYAPILLILLMFLMVLFMEVFGCKLTDLFTFTTDSLFTPGIKVIG